MKLIIDIPKEDIELIHKTSFVEDERTIFKQSPSDRQGTMMLFRLMDSVKNGIPLDDVKAKIEKQIERDFAFAETETLKVPCHYGIANGLQNAIRFLDNIGKAERESE